MTAKTTMRITVSVHNGLRRLARRLRRSLERLTLQRPDRREMDMLLRADERLLKDIGLTRGDMHAVADCRKMAKAAAARRSEAIAAAVQLRWSVADPDWTRQTISQEIRRHGHCPRRG